MNKKKKTIIITAAIILASILLIPIPRWLKDGGTVEYNAVLYSVHKIHSIWFGQGYEEGTRIKILGFTVYDDVMLPDGSAQKVPVAGYDICRIVTDGLLEDILEGKESPVEVRYGVGGEQGYITSTTRDPEVIRGFIEALREITIKERITDRDRMGYAADGNADITLEMEDGRTAKIQLDRDAGTKVHTDNAVYLLDNTDKLNIMCTRIQIVE
ncbi:hypothetical protein SAMN02910456_02208 [Ruminococcaceae bacterium YRB3002]|nr:hypothetical protein SAMN02910456_02208 [Ruminococcaceae bacterium YRB3002]